MTDTLVTSDLTSMLQARAILPEDQLEKDFFIPYCALADCIRDKRTNKWSAGKLWDDSFQQKGDK